jgi:hypothetical protein
MDIFDEAFRKLKYSFKEKRTKLAWLGAYGVKEYDTEHRRMTRDFDAITLPSEVLKVREVMESLSWREIRSPLTRKGELTFTKKVRGKELKLDVYTEGKLYDFEHTRVEYNLLDVLERLYSDPLPPTNLAISKLMIKPPLSSEHKYDLTRLLLKTKLNPNDFTRDIARNFWLRKRVKRNMLDLRDFVKGASWLTIRERRIVLKKIRELIY